MVYLIGPFDLIQVSLIPAIEHVMHYLPLLIVLHLILRCENHPLILTELCVSSSVDT